MKFHTIVNTSEFDPTSLMITNQLSPVAINLFPAPQQTLWLYNPYCNDISLKIISDSAELTLANNELVAKSHQHVPLIVTFAPNYLGNFEVNELFFMRFSFNCPIIFQLKIEVVFNECKSSLKIYGECTGREQDLLDENFRNNSPNYDLKSQLNPFVLHGDNVNVILPQHGICSENLIGLQNNSRVCIKYEWEDFLVAAATCEIFVEPKRGYLKPGFTKLFRLSVKSLGAHMMMRSIPIKCSLFQYSKENFREYSLPDGYFEYTDKGYYEKVSES